MYTYTPLAMERNGVALSGQRRCPNTHCEPRSIRRVLFYMQIYRDSSDTRESVYIYEWREKVVLVRVSLGTELLIPGDVHQPAGLRALPCTTVTAPSRPTPLDQSHKSDDVFSFLDDDSRECFAKSSDTHQFWVLLCV